MWFSYNTREGRALLSQKDGSPNVRQMALMLLGLGFQWAASILIGIFVGMWFATKWHLGSVAVLLGLLLGFGAGIYATIRQVRQLQGR